MTASLIFIILFTTILCVGAFALGFEISDKQSTKFSEDILLNLSSEEEKEETKFKFKMIRDTVNHSIRMLIICIAFSIFMLILNLLDYRDRAMESLKTGKFGCEEVVHTRTSGDQVKVDTTYNFYRIKPE